MRSGWSWISLVRRLLLTGGGALFAASIPGWASAQIGPAFSQVRAIRPPLVDPAPAQPFQVQAIPPAYGFPKTPVEDAKPPAVLSQRSPAASEKSAGEKKKWDPREILGPLPTRNYQPVHLLFFEFTPERAYALPRGRVDLRLDVSETNTLLDDAGKEPSFKANLEMTRFAWRARYGLTDRLTVGMNVPLVYIHGPFLDGFIESVERLFDKVRGDRRDETPDQVEAFLVSGGTTEFRLDEANFGVGDVSAEAMYQFLQESFWVPAVSGRAAVKFPTGDFDKLRGSEKFDYALGLAAQKIWGLWSASVGGGVTFPGNPFRSSRLDPDPILYGHLSLERLIATRWSLALQLKWTGGLMDLENTGPDVRPLTDRSVEIQGAVKWAFKDHWLAQVGLVQDIADSAAVDSDFSFYLSLGYQFDTKGLSFGAL